MEHGRAEGLQADLLLQFAHNRCGGRLTALHAAAGKVPARGEALADEKNAALSIVQHRAHAERHGRGERPEGKQPGQIRSMSGSHCRPAIRTRRSYAHYARRLRDAMRASTAALRR